MATLGFSSLPCACDTNGKSNPIAANAASAMVRNGFIVSPVAAVSADLCEFSFRARDSKASLQERRCSHSIQGVSTRRRWRQLTRRGMQIGGLARLHDLTREIVRDDV